MPDKILIFSGKNSNFFKIEIYYEYQDVPTQYRGSTFRYFRVPHEPQIGRNKMETFSRRIPYERPSAKNGLSQAESRLSQVEAMTRNLVRKFSSVFFESSISSSAYLGIGVYVDLADSAKVHQLKRTFRGTASPNPKAIFDFQRMDLKKSLTYRSSEM